MNGVIPRGLGVRSRQLPPIPHPSFGSPIFYADWYAGSILNSSSWQGFTPLKTLENYVVNELGRLRRVFRLDRSGDRFRFPS